MRSLVRYHMRREPARLLAVLAALCILLPTPAWGQSAIATVLGFQGGLRVQPPRRPLEQAKLRQQLFNAYRAQTQASQRASLRFGDGSVLRMNQRTDLLLRSATLVRVSGGEVAIVENSGIHHQIQTATALTSALGTEFDVRIAPPATSSYGKSPARFPPGTTTVSVVTGTVVVSNQYGRVTVTPNHWTHVVPGRAPTTPTAHNARADVRWANGLP